MLAEIQQQMTSLRSVTTEDKSKPSLANALVQEFEAEKNEAYYLDLGMEQWLPHVQELSFPTTSVPLSQDDALLIRACYHHLHTSKAPAATLPADLLTPLTQLGRRLQPALDLYSQGAFCKLSGRSSKDAPLHTSKLLESHAELCSSAAASDDNERLRCLFDAALGVMHVEGANSAAHCLWLLVNSQRVDEDLEVALRHVERWEQSVVIRSWWPGVTSDLEFRMFVVDGKPTGMTQYNHLVYSARLDKDRERLAASLLAHFEARVWPRLRGTPFHEATGGRFVVDFAVHPDALQLEGAIAKDHIRLIELNCFYEATGMGLYDYQKDSAQLSTGPFELRARTTPLPLAHVKLENEWRSLLRGENGARNTDGVWHQLEAELGSRALLPKPNIVANAA